MGEMRYARPTVDRAMISCTSKADFPSNSGDTTAMSISLHSLALPRACEPYRITSSTRTADRSRYTKSSILVASSTWLATIHRTPSSLRTAPALPLDCTRLRANGSSLHDRTDGSKTSSVPRSTQDQSTPQAQPDHGSSAVPRLSALVVPLATSRPPAGRSRRRSQENHREGATRHFPDRARRCSATPPSPAPRPHPSIAQNSMTDAC